MGYPYSNVYKYNGTSQNGHEGHDHNVPHSNHEEEENDHLHPVWWVNVFLFNDNGANDNSNEEKDQCISRVLDECPNGMDSMLTLRADLCLSERWPEKSQANHTQDTTGVQDSELAQVEANVGENERKPSYLHIISDHSACPQWGNKGNDHTQAGTKETCLHKTTSHLNDAWWTPLRQVREQHEEHHRKSVIEQRLPIILF